MITLDYYFRTDNYELDNLLAKGLSYSYYKTAREYGFALYLTDKPRINLNGKNIITVSHFKNLDNILTVTNFQELLTEYLTIITATSIVNVNIESCPSTINGIPVEAGDIIGLGAQSNANQNGIYLCYGVGEPLGQYGDISSYLTTFGLTPRFGTKFVQKYMEANKYNGLRVTSQNLMILYNTTNIKYIKVYNENK